MTDAPVLPAKPDADRFRNLLAFVLVGTFLSCIPLLIFKSIPKSNEQIITYMVGQLSGMALTALGFYFVKQAGQDALDNKRADNTGKLAEAVVAAANGTPPPPADDKAQGADEVAEAARKKADAIANGQQPEAEVEPEQ